MATDDFMKQQYLTLRDEIRESKSRIFWLLIIGMVLVMVAGYLAAEHPSAFANAAIPFLLIGVMLAFVSEQNNIARAGRYLRETVEPRIENLMGWEHWLETKPQLREVDHAFVLGFTVLFLVFFAITTSLTLVQLDKNATRRVRLGGCGRVRAGRVLHRDRHLAALAVEHGGEPIASASKISCRGADARTAGIVTPQSVRMTIDAGKSCR